jgi:capsular exopolysaccharide synthesis family protein
MIDKSNPFDSVGSGPSSANSDTSDPGPAHAPLPDATNLRAGLDSMRPMVAAPAGYDPMVTPESHALDYVRVLYKRRWTAITAFAIVVGLTMLVTFTATPQYEATTQILIENEQPNVVNFQQVVDEIRSIDYYQTQYRLLESRLLARRVLSSEKLWDEPALIGRPVTFSLNPLWLASAAYGGVKGIFVSSELAPEASGGETLAQAQAIDALLRDLTVAPVRNSRLVDIKFQSESPELSARVVNALAREYIQQNLEFKFLATTEANEFLAARLSEQRQLVEQSEVALQKYREVSESVSLEDKENIVVQRLADLNGAVTKARTERIQKEAAWNQIRAIQDDRATLDTHPVILSNVFVQQLKGEVNTLQQEQARLSDTLGERHPDMRRIESAIDNAQLKLQTEIAKVVVAIRNDYEAALAQERSLTAALNQQETEALSLSRESIAYGALQRDAASNKQLFEGLLQRAKETDIAGELKTSNIRVVDPAEMPRRPASPNKVMNLTAALIGGSLLGIMLAFFFEYLDSRIKSPQEIRAELGLPFLGMIPAMAGTQTGLPLLMSEAVPHDFTEAIRGIRTNLLFSSAEAGPKSAVVTSTAPGEGKTMVSTNVAVALAQAGNRVLYIDADMRRPKGHELFGLPLEPGLSNLLVGESKASEAVHRTATANLWVMAAGKHPPNPAELLGSRRFKELARSLREHFDWIVIDTPPVMAVTDAAVVAHSADAVIFVVGAEMTARGAAKTALEQLDTAKARYFGAVLNRVDVRRNSYYYANYYRREYRQYYAATTT